MTEQEFDTLTWRFNSRWSKMAYPSTVYDCNEISNLMRTKSVEYKNGKPTNRTSTMYFYNGVAFKSKQRLLEAITDTFGSTSPLKSKNYDKVLRRM